MDSNYIPISLKNLLDDITLKEHIKFDPAALQRLHLENLANAYKGEINLVDPSNPFIFLLEASNVNTVASILETEIALRKNYPILSQTYDDLFHHMSDRHYLTVFNQPVNGKFTFILDVNTINNAVVDNPDLQCRMITIPRDTYVVVNGVTFTMHYPVNIKIFYNNTIEVSYDTTYPSPIHDLKTNVIEYNFRVDPNGQTWLSFDVDMSQFKIRMFETPIDAPLFFKEDITLTDKFYYARVFNKSNMTKNKWVEMRTTHTDQVFDPYTPTAVLKVADDYLSVYIPPTYYDQGLLDGVIRIDIYETKGNITIDFDGYTLDSFVTTLESIDEARDVTPYTTAMTDVSFTCYAKGIVSGGNNTMTFTQLREEVINTALGEMNLPITPAQIKSKIVRAGFDVIKYVDTYTNRIFLASKYLPNPLNAELITPANITIEKFVTTLEMLRSNPDVCYNYNRYTIRSRALYSIENGKIEHYSQDRLNYLSNLTPTSFLDVVNNTKFVYSPFWYVLDNSLNEFEVRAYSLDDPVIKHVSFVSQNEYAMLRVNTNTHAIEKIENGYKIYLRVRSDDFYKGLNDSFVGVQLGFIPVGENKHAFINGSLEGIDTDGERIYSFTIKTNYDIDSNNVLYLDNFSMFDKDTLKLGVNLTHQFKILFLTSSKPTNYRGHKLDKTYGDFLLDNDNIVVTEESLLLEFGKPLKALWTQSISNKLGSDYAVYVNDVPLIEEKDVYRVFDSTGTIFDENLNTELLRKKGDIVVDDLGEIQYKHRKGDTYLVNGDPVEVTESKTIRMIDMLFIDGRYRFANDDTYQHYLKEMRDVLTTWIYDDLSDLTEITLEQTKIYFHPYRSMGDVRVMVSKNKETKIKAQQSFKLKLYVTDIVYNDARIRTNLRKGTIKLLNDYLHNRTISMSDIVSMLKELYGASVVSFSITGLGGDKNLDTVSLIELTDSLSLRKILIDQEDGTYIIEEDIDVEFIQYHSTVMTA